MARLRSIAVWTVIALALLVAPGCRNPLSDAIQAKIDEYNFEPIRNANLVESQALVLLGGTRQLTLATIPADATNQNATWTSSDLAVVTASNSGLLTGESCGRATIEMVTEDGGFMDSCEVAVSIIRWHTALGAEKHDVANCIRPTTDGGYIACGYFGGATPAFVYDRGFIVKLDADGAVQWQLKPSNSDWLQSVRELSDGSFVAAGYGYASRSDGISDLGAYLVKVYPSGTMAWEYGGPAEDEGDGESTNYTPLLEYRDVIPTSGGGFLAVGSAHRRLWNGGGYDETWPAAVVPHLASGVAAEAAQCYFSPVAGDYLFAIESDGTDYITAGSSGSGGFYLLKVSAGTPPVPVTEFGSSGQLRYGTSGMLQGLCIDGGYIYCTGMSFSDNVLPSPIPVLGAHGGLQDAYAAQINATNGDINWQTLLGGSADWDWGCGIIVDPAGGEIVIGESASTDIAGALEANHGGRDIYAAKLTVNGVLEWQTSLGGTANDGGFFVAPGQGGGFIMAGRTRSTDLLELLDPVNDTLAADDFYIAKIY